MEWLGMCLDGGSIIEKVRFNQGQSDIIGIIRANARQKHLTGLYRYWSRWFKNVEKPWMQGSMVSTCTHVLLMIFWKSRGASVISQPVQERRRAIEAEERREREKEEASSSDDDVCRCVSLDTLHLSSRCVGMVLKCFWSYFSLFLFFDCKILIDKANSGPWDKHLRSTSR